MKQLHFTHAYNASGTAIAMRAKKTPTMGFSKYIYLLLILLLFRAGDARSQTTDTIPPIAIAQDVTVHLDGGGNGSTTAAAVNNGSSDESGIASITLSQTDFDCSHVGANPVTLTVTDVNGNVSTADAIVTVIDVMNPLLISKSVTVILNAAGTGSTTASAAITAAIDACGIASRTLSKTNFTCSDAGVNMVTLTVTDVNGNSTMNVVAITVVDQTPPVAIAQNITVALVNGTVTITPEQIDNGSSDVCGIAKLKVTPCVFTCSNIGNNTVTLTVTDVNGNVSTTTAVVTVTGVLPTVSITQGLQQGLTQGGAIVLTASSPTATSYYWVNGPSTATYSVYASGTYTVKATNAGGCQATASITVNYDAAVLLSSYTILATDDKVELKNRVTVFNGGVGNTDVNGKVIVTDYSFVNAPGTFVRAHEINVSDCSIVTTKICSPVPSSILPPFFYNPYCGCGNNKSVPHDATVVITDNIMENVTIGPHATVTFTSPQLYIKNLVIEDGAVVNFAACATVRVCDNVDIKPWVNFNSVNPVLVTMYVEGKLNIKEGSKVVANVYAKDDILVRGKECESVMMKGMFIGRKIEIRDYVNVYWNTTTTCNTVLAKTNITSVESDLASKAFDVNVYPNPGTGAFNIKLSSESTAPYYITVYDLKGKLIESILIDGSAMHSTIGSEYAEGVYIMKIAQEDKVNTIRLVKLGQ